MLHISIRTSAPETDDPDMIAELYKKRFLSKKVDEDQKYSNTLDIPRYVDNKPKYVDKKHIKKKVMVKNDEFNELLQYIKKKRWNLS